MERTLRVLDKMVAEGIIGPYAIGGAVAAYKYIEAAMTEDLDILVAFPGSGGLVSLAPIFGHLATLGFTDFRREGLMIEGWPVQFLPVASELDREALDSAALLPNPSNEATGTARVILPEYLVAIALRVGRPKDLLRVSQFLGESAVDIVKLGDVLRKHDLITAWRKYCLATGTPPDLVQRRGGGA